MGASSSSNSKGPRSPNAPALIERQSSLTDAIRRVVTNHGEAKQKIFEKQDFRQSLAKAQLEVRLQRRKTMSLKVEDLEAENTKKIAPHASGPPKSSPLHHHVNSGKSTEKRGKHRKEHHSGSKLKETKKARKQKKIVPWPAGWSPLGVSMRFLHTMYSRIKPRTTTREMVEYVIRNETKPLSSQGGSYVELLAINEETDFHGNVVIGKATHYVSHAWDAPFAELVSALDVMITSQTLNPALVFFWIDIFSLNQHTENEEDSKELVEIATRDAIKNVDGVALVLGSWERPLGLNRSWCLWEILCALSAKKPFEIYLPGKSMYELHDRLTQEFPYVAASLTTIDYKNSTCSVLATRDRIIAAIDSVGQKRATRALEKAVRRWLINTSTICLTELMQHGVKFSQKGSRVDQKKALRLAEDLGGLLREHELFDEAENVSRTGLSLREILYGKTHASTIVAMQNLALVMQGRGEDAEAEVFYRKALVAQEETLGPDDSKTLLSVNNFAVYCQKRRKFHEAETLYRRAIDGFTKKDGPEHEHTLLSMHNLASLLQLRKEFNEAETLYRKVLEGRIDSLGLKDKLTLQTLNRLGTVCHDSGKSDEAVGIFMCTLEGREEILGKDHRQTLQTVSDLAACLLDGDDILQAKEYFERAMLGRLEVLGKHHEDTLRSICDLAACLYQLGDVKKSEELQRKALRGREKTLGDEHLDTLRSVSNLAAVCYSNGRMKEAERLYKRALTGFDKTLGRKDPSTLLCADTLARLLRAQGKIKAAIPLYERALKGYTETIGPNARDTLNTLGNMGLCLKAGGQVTKGEHMIQKAIEMMQHDSTLGDPRAVKKFETALFQSKELVLDGLLKNLPPRPKKKEKTRKKKKSASAQDEPSDADKKRKARAKDKTNKGKEESAEKNGKKEEERKKRSSQDSKRTGDGGTAPSKARAEGKNKLKGEKKKALVREKKATSNAFGVDGEELPLEKVVTKRENIVPLSLSQTKIHPSAQPAHDDAPSKNKHVNQIHSDSDPMKKPPSKILSKGRKQRMSATIDRLKNFEKLAQKKRDEALALKASGDIKGALAKLSEYKKMQVELTERRKARITELRARLSKNDDSSGKTLKTPSTEAIPCEKVK